MAMEDDALDVEALASRYAGAAKVERIAHVAHLVRGRNQQEAFRLALEEARAGTNTTSYVDLVGQANERGWKEFQVDSEWVEATDRKAQQKQEKLERELAGYKTNLIKESIRMGHTDLGEFFYERGDYMDAFRSYVRTRDYCTTGKHVLWTCLGATKAALAMGNAQHAISYVQKGEAVPDLANEPVVQAKFNAAAGLAQLMLREYGMAARRFCAVHPDLAQDPSWLVSPQDAAVYGALCALAFFGREEMRKRCIENVQFAQVLEHVPEIREMLHGMFCNQHAQGLEILDRLMPMLKLDKYLEEHLDTLQREIRRCALVSYTLPFSTLRLASVAKAFRTDIAGIEAELAGLIGDGQVLARIDSAHKILYARRSDRRRLVFAQALANGRAQLEECESALLRSSLQRHDDVCVHPSPICRIPSTSLVHDFPNKASQPAPSP
eukprot:CAMPEP_0113926964 /NCGR_PEP_ID=MMETSP1159-20121227/4045_1 /TAXON_ID=88271 /ORGANISM="Picocystis salinarum" /LENGTH=437 /DNA_ID=CAMNT_0000927411 /DNA_START=44 /DNA_END=1354 /DNA_ORIENTATION=- /assembly_acc=CAM_ASM_000767